MLAMVLVLAACGGETTGGETASDGTSITIFNSKMEIQSQMEEMAKKYSAEKGVNVEVYYSSDTVAAHMSTRYASNEPYTIAMVDAKDVFSLGPDHAVDLSGEDWVADTTQAISVDGKVLGFPVCIEARGIIYNGEAIRAIVPDFDPTEVKTTEDFQDIIDALIDGGMDA
ncbi:MAG: extracellular solute-binding protein, partial [Oscillospiraceae bacterium]|nr:extracellular solute-binding protein [Oscillospiraceae bacterium]